MADAAAVEQDPLAAYQQTDEQRTVMYRDDLTGTGETAEKGKLLKVAYKGRLLATGVQFDQSPGYAFKLGDGKVIPGWEQGIGVRVFFFALSNVCVGVLLDCGTGGSLFC